MPLKCLKLEKGIICRTRSGFLSIQEVRCWKKTRYDKHCTSKKGDYAFQLAASLIQHQTIIQNHQTNCNWSADMLGPGCTWSQVCASAIPEHPQIDICGFFAWQVSWLPAGSNYSTTLEACSLDRQCV